MKTITFNEDLKIDKCNFENLADFQNYIASLNELPDTHKAILDERIQLANESPEKYLTLEQLEKQI